MNILRVVLGALVVTITIGAWESCRDHVLRVVKEVAEVGEEEAPKKAAIPEKAVIPDSNAAESKNKKKGSEIDEMNEQIIIESKDSEIAKGKEDIVTESNEPEVIKRNGSVAIEKEEPKIIEKNVSAAVEEKKLGVPEVAEVTHSGSCQCLMNFENGFAKVADKAKNSVVNIATLQLVDEESMGLPDIFKGTPFDDVMRDFFDSPHRKRTRRTHALGSGFIAQVDEDRLYIVTNSHVVEKASKIVIYLSDKTEIPAEVHATDQRTDIAVLVVDLKANKVDVSNLKPVEWGDSDEISEGNWVVAIGNPFGFGSTVTSGIVSAKSRDLNTSRGSLSLADDLIQHSAAINMGNSGGCLLDIHARVVGINNAIISNSGGNIGIGFAIPSNVARPVVAQLIEFKRTVRGWLGISVQKVDKEQAASVCLLDDANVNGPGTYGAYISKVVPGGPACKGGAIVGDIVIEIDGIKISTKNSIQSIIGRAKIGSTIKVCVWREGDTGKWGPVDLVVVVGDFDKASKDGMLDDKDDQASVKDSEKAIEPLGISVANIPEGRKDEYPKGSAVVVTNVEEETSFYGSVFLPGDVIIRANNKRVTSAEHLYRIISDLSGDPKNRRKPIPFIVNRGGMQMMVAVPLDFEKSSSRKSSTPNSDASGKSKKSEKSGKSEMAGKPERSAGSGVRSKNSDRRRQSADASTPS